MLDILLEIHELNNEKSKENMITNIKMEALDSIIKSYDKKLYERNKIYQTIIDTFKMDYVKLQRNKILSLEREEPKPRNPVGYKIQDKKEETYKETKE